MMNGLSSKKIFKNFLLLMLVIFFGEQIYAQRNNDSTNSSTGITFFAISAACIGSLVKGVHNIRAHNHLLAQCQADYHFKSRIDFFAYPSQYAQDLVCANSQPVDNSYHCIHGDCMQQVYKKAMFFDRNNPAALWDFEEFQHAFPHTSFESSYAISKSYLGSFGYQDLGMLKNAVAQHINKIESDFTALQTLTNAWSYAIAIPYTLNEYRLLQNIVNSYDNYYGAYTALGALGYSALYNCQRVKQYLLDLAKMHIFLVNFKELLNAAIDHDETSLFNEPGVVLFSLRHVTYAVQQII